METIKTTIKTINGKLCTVIWHEKKPDGVNLEYSYTKHGCEVYCSPPFSIIHIATALFALPRHPKPEDAGLLYRYASEGIFPFVDGVLCVKSKIPCFVNGKVDCYISEKSEHSETIAGITYAEDNQGNKIEVAIYEND